MDWNEIARTVFALLVGWFLLWAFGFFTLFGRER
jgi:hypothetical protein